MKIKNYKKFALGYNDNQAITEFKKTDPFLTIFISAMLIKFCNSMNTRSNCHRITAVSDVSALFKQLYNPATQKKIIHVMEYI